MGTSKPMILVPLFDLTSPEQSSRLRWDFKSKTGTTGLAGCQIENTKRHFELIFRRTGLIAIVDLDQSALAGPKHAKRHAFDAVAQIRFGPILDRTFRRALE